MAILKGKFLSGMLGNLIIRKRKDQTVIAQKMEPGTMKQTPATKKAGKTFGMASALAVTIRDPRFAFLNNFFDSTMINRLNSAVYKILIASRDKSTMIYDFKDGFFSQLAGFEFNTSSTVLKNLGAIPAVTFNKEKLTVQLPDMEAPSTVKFPSGSGQCTIAVTVISIILEQGRWAISPQIQTIEITKAKPKNAPSLQFEAPAGCLCIVYTLLHYQAKIPSGVLSVNQKTFSPACICDALFTPGVYQAPSKQFERCLNTEFILQKDQLQ